MVVTLIGLIMAAVIPNNQLRIKRAQVERTVSEMSAITDAAISFTDTTGSCPIAISDLSPDFIKIASFYNSFGKAYIMGCNSGMVTVSTNIPAGAAKDKTLGSLFTIVSAGTFDTLSISKRTPIGAAGRLLYDKKYAH